MRRRILLGIDKNEHVIYSVSTLERIVDSSIDIFSPKCKFRFYKFNILTNFEYACQEFSFPCPYFLIWNYAFVFADEASSLLIAPNLQANTSLPLNKRLPVALLNVETGKFETFSADYDLTITDVWPTKIHINYKRTLIFYSSDHGWTLLAFAENIAYVFDMIFISGNLFRGTTPLSIKFKLRSRIEPGPVANILSGLSNCATSVGRNGICCSCWVLGQIKSAILNLETNQLIHKMYSFPTWPVNVDALHINLCVTHGALFLAYVTKLKNNAENTILTEAHIFKVDIASDADSLIFQRVVTLDLKFDDRISFAAFECSQCTAFTFCDNQNYQIFTTWKRDISLNSLALKSVCAHMRLDFTETELVENLHIRTLARDCFGPEWTILKAGKRENLRKPWYWKLFQLL